MEAALDFVFRNTVERPIPAHNHQCYEVVYYKSGQGISRLSDKKLRYSKSHYAIIRPLTIHDEQREAATETICIGISFKQSGFPLQEGVFRHDPEDPLLPLCESILDEKQAQSFRSNRMLDLLVNELVIRLERRLMNNVVSANPEFQVTLEYMNRNFTQKIDFEALSAKSGYSYDWYRHLFKERTGLSPVQYILQKKIDSAKTLLHHTELSVNAIAMECGFSTDAQFCRLFKREVGQTPLFYRKNVSVR